MQQLRTRLLKQFRSRSLRSRRLRLLVWCARKHRHHHWSPLAMLLLLCCVIGSAISHIDGALIVGEMLVALVDMMLQGYNARHHLKHRHRQHLGKPEWQHIRRRHVWSEIRFKAPLALCILIIILIVLLGFHLPL